MSVLAEKLNTGRNQLEEMSNEMKAKACQLNGGDEKAGNEYL